MEDARNRYIRKNINKRTYLKKLYWLFNNFELLIGMSGLRLFSNIIIALLAVWASYAYVNSKIGNTIMFPLVSPSEENIPYYKLQTV